MQDIREYVIVNFYHLVDIERPHEVRRCKNMQQILAGVVLQAVLLGSRCRHPSSRAAPTPAAGSPPSFFEQVIKRHREWLEGREVRGRI